MPAIEVFEPVRTAEYIAGPAGRRAKTLGKDDAADLSSTLRAAGMTTIAIPPGTIAALDVILLAIARTIVGPINRITAGFNEGADQVNDAMTTGAGGCLR